jgi:hypothetical protein
MNGGPFPGHCRQEGPGGKIQFITPPIIPDDFNLWLYLAALVRNV